MNTVSDVLLKGGPVALIIACALAFKYGIDAVGNWRRVRRGITTSTITDAATTNAMLLETLRGERADSRAKDAQIDELEHKVDVLRTQIYEQRRQYETEIADLHKKVQEVTIQLEGLQQRIHEGLPRPPLQ
jgi:uncharacterized protein YlxW (UPF0749 family)